MSDSQIPDLLEALEQSIAEAKAARLRHDQCRPCVELHNRARPATVRATVPMAGERPRYGLCDECMADIAEYAEDVYVL